MPTNKVEPTVLETAAVGEAKPKRVRAARSVQKPAASKPSSEEGHEPAQELAKKAPARKRSAPQTEASAPTVQGSDGNLQLSFSTDDISVRAYFIGEHRRSLGHCGDSEGDWLEAERQLRSEALSIAASLRKK